MAAHLKTEAMADARILIIAPAHLLSTWRRELQSTIGEREYIQVIESGAEPISRFSRWTVMSYNNVVAQRERLEKLAPHLLILDEAHYLRHGDAAWTGALVGTRAKDGTETPGFAMQVPVVWPMTASEIVNNPRDLFGLLRITRHPLGDNFFRFGQRYCDGHQVPAGRRGMVWDFSGASNLGELGEKLRPWILRRELDDVVQLPPKQDPVVRTVEFSPEERAAYRAGVRESIAAYKRGADVLTAMTAAMRACALAKTPHVIARVREMLEAGGKVGVICRVPDVFDQFEAAFPGAVVRIDGSVRGADAKAAAERAFQTDPGKRICALQTRSGSGLTLTRGERTVMVDIPFTNEDMVQAEGRFRRIGTTGPVTHERFHALGTFDPVLARLTATKGARATEFRVGVQGTGTTDAAAARDQAPVSEMASAHAVMQELIRIEREMERAEVPVRVGATPTASRVGAEAPPILPSIETALGA